MNINRLEIESVRQTPRVVRMVTHPPLRLLQTTGLSDTAEVYTATYGGGLLQGDTVRLDLRCGANTRLILRSQANTHIYKNTDQTPTTQIINGLIESQGTAIICPHPTVLHEDALYRQQQHWSLKEDASLILLEWMQSGRSESGEQFKFKEYLSRVTFSVNQQMVFEEAIQCRPDQNDPMSPARFYGLDHSLTVYLLGPKAAKCVAPLEAFSNPQNHTTTTLPVTESHAPKGPFYSLSPMPLCQGFIFRALAQTSSALEPVVTLISQFVQGR